jgi:hypothetical protein
MSPSEGDGMSCDQEISGLHYFSLYLTVLSWYSVLFPVTSFSCDQVYSVAINSTSVVWNLYLIIVASSNQIMSTNMSYVRRKSYRARSGVCRGWGDNSHVVSGWGFMQRAEWAGILSWQRNLSVVCHFSEYFYCTGSHRHYGTIQKLYSIQWPKMMTGK